MARMVWRVCSSETRSDSKSVWAARRISLLTVNFPVVLNECSQLLTVSPVIARLVEMEVFGWEFTSYARNQSKRSKLLLAKISMAGLSVSFTPSGCALLRLSREAGRELEVSSHCAGCFS